MDSVAKYTDPELISLLQKKDEEACLYLYEKYGGAIYGLIHNVVPDQAAANEVLLNAFVAIINSIEHYDPSTGRLFIWMMQLTREIAIGKLKESTQRIYSDSELEKNKSNGLGKLIGKLRNDEQQIIHLTYHKGYSVDEVADVMKMTTENVQIKMNEALVSINSNL